jgi:hypothetical protein
MKKRTGKAKASVRPLSRPLLDKMLRDLTERIGRQIVVVEAITRANTPNDLHIYIEYQLRTVFGVMLDSQLRGLKDIKGLAEMLYKDGRAAS